MRKKCIRCLDTGKYLGNGFMMADCTLCKSDESDEVHSINRHSKSYLDAIKDIMRLNPDISRKEAVRMFDEAYMKV